MRTYRVTHTPILHHGRRYGPGERIELADEHARSLYTAGLIERMGVEPSPRAGDGLGKGALAPKTESDTMPAHHTQPAPRKGAKA